MHSAPFHERNYPGDPIVLSYFGVNRNLSLSGEAAFKAQMYLNMLGAGLQRSTNIMSWRSTNVWGMLMWQLNEVSERARSVCVCVLLWQSGWLAGWLACHHCSAKAAALQ